MLVFTETKEEKDFMIGASVPRGSLRLALQAHLLNRGSTAC